MTEYIDKTKLLEFRDAMVEIAKRHGRFNDGADDAEIWKSAVKSAPAADVAPVMHGEWIGRPLCGNDDCRCSVCQSWENIHAYPNGTISFKYCPNCGAKMDGGDL